MRSGETDGHDKNKKNPVFSFLKSYWLHNVNLTCCIGHECFLIAKKYISTLFLGPDQPIEFVLSCMHWLYSWSTIFHTCIASLLTTVRLLTLVPMVAEQTILNEWSLNLPTICVSVCASVTRRRLDLGLPFNVTCSLLSILFNVCIHCKLDKTERLCDIIHITTCFNIVCSSVLCRI